MLILYFFVWQVAYYGKAGKVLDFFESIGLVCDAHFNPADFICKYIAICKKYFSLLICN